MVSQESLGRFSQSLSSLIQSKHVSSVGRSVQAPERSRWREMKVGCSVRSRWTRWSRWVDALRPRSCSRWGCRLFFSPQLGRAAKSLYEWNGPEPKNQEIPAFRILAEARQWSGRHSRLQLCWLQGRGASATLEARDPRVWRSEPTWSCCGSCAQGCGNQATFPWAFTGYLCR